jgi:hypothetical protein
MKFSAIIALTMALLTEAMADEDCKGFVSDDTCYFAIPCNCNLASAKQTCEKEGAELAVIKTETVYNLAKNYVKDSWSYGNTPYAVFWVDQSYDYMQSQVKVPDGYLSKGAFENMWYHRQPSMCQMSKDLVLVFRPDDVLIKNPNMEKYQGFYTIGASSTWNAMCMTDVADE